MPKTYNLVFPCVIKLFLFNTGIHFYWLLSRNENLIINQRINLNYEHNFSDMYEFKPS